MSIQPKIKSDLKRSLKVDQAFEFINLYKGVPLVYKATLLEIGRETVRFRVIPHEAICLTWEHQTIVLDEKNNTAIRGRIVNFHLPSGIVELTDLEYADRGFGVRMMVRVEPEHPIPVEVSKDNERISGEVLDVSLTGFGIRLPSLGKENPIQPRDTVRLVLKLMDTNVYPLGTVTTIQQDGDSFRVATRFAMEVTIPVVIARYITHRRAEIHRELAEAYEAAQ